MANNRIILRRTSTAGRTPNTTASYATNTQYISAGELALNMTDQILYTSNGSVLITVGANQVNQRITNSLTLDNDRNLFFKTINTSATVGFRQQSDDNFVFYSTNTTYGQRAVWAIFANSDTSALSILTPITFNGNVTRIVANGTLGTAGQVLASNGSGIYWTSSGGGSGTVTSVGSGNGLTGGPITTSGTLSVLANTGIVANTTGLFVNATYISTLTANNATNLNGQAASFYTNATNITSGTLPYAQIPANIVNTTGSFTLSGVTTFGANVVLGSSGLSANGGFGTAGQVLHSNGTAAHWAADDNAGGTVTSVASGNGITGGTITTTGTLTAVAGAGVVVNASGINVLANNGITANSTGTFVNAQTPLVANATGLHIATSAGNGTFTSGISAITVDSVGRVTSVTGSAGYVTSSGVTSVATGNGMTGGTITTTGTVSILANSGVVANATGLFVNANNGITANSTGVFVTQGTGTVVNATGVHVNATYIGTISANNASFLGGTAAASYVQNTDSRTLSGNLVISGTSFTPSSNTVLLGNSTRRWVLSANTGSFSGAVSGITTLAAGNTTITGFANVSTSVNSALLTVGTSFVANTLGAYHTGTVNAASLTVGSSTIANTTGVYTGVANASTLSTGTTFIANSSQVTVTVPVSANGSTGTAGHVLTSNGTVGSPYWASATGGGYYKGGSAAVGTLAVGGQNLFRVNANTLNFNTTIATGENAQATGPISVGSGITLTVQSGARVSIV